MTKTIVATLLSIAAAVASAGCTKSEASTGAAVHVTVNEKGFVPASVTIARGQPAAIEFTRTTDETCAREVVFPDLQIKKELPLNTPVTVTLPAGDPKTLGFQCGMAMLMGSVVVQ